MYNTIFNLFYTSKGLFVPIFSYVIAHLMCFKIMWTNPILASKLVHENSTTNTIHVCKQIKIGNINSENKLIRPERVAWNLCNVFKYRSKGFDEDYKLFCNFIPCKCISYIFSKRQISQTPYLYSRVSQFEHQYDLLCIQMHTKWLY